MTKPLPFWLTSSSSPSSKRQSTRIGFSDRRLGKNLPTTDSQRGRDLRGQLKAIGLYKESGHEALRGCVTFPLLDDAGNITGIFGRRIDKNGKGPQEISIGRGSVQSSVDSFQEEKAAVPSASPTTDDCQLITNDSSVTFVRDDRRYRVRGLEKNNALGCLKVNILASRDDLVHLDAIDLVKARSRASFIKATATELFVDADTRQARHRPVVVEARNTATRTYRRG